MNLVPYKALFVANRGPVIYTKPAIMSKIYLDGSNYSAVFVFLTTL